MRLTLFYLLISNIVFGQKQLFTELPLFENQKNGYACYRIPAIIKAPNGGLLAFAEARTFGCYDFGNVDIVLRRSPDNGITWTEQKVVVDNGHLQAGNPAPVADLHDPNYPDGRIFLFYNTGIASETQTRKGRGLREVFYKTSTDHGQTWSAPVNITPYVHRPNRPDINPNYNFQQDWRSYANTPGHAIQLRHGAYQGRLLVAANHSQGDPKPNFNEYRAHAFYSDDHGQTWHLSESVEVESSNESIAAQSRNGAVILNIRQQNGLNRRRLVAISNTGGATWNSAYFDNELISPVCQASLLAATLPDGNEVLLFSNPASTETREKMTVRLSYSNGTSWATSRLIRAGASGYSDLVQQSDGLIGLLYEHGDLGGIHYAQFNFAWLNGGDNKARSIEKDPKRWNYASDFNFQLADPVISSSSIFFEKENKIELSFAYDGAKLYYTLDGSEPTQNSAIYTQPVSVYKSGTFKAKAFFSTFHPSNTVSVNYLKITKKYPLNNITLIEPPNKNYPGTGATGLIDLKKGSNDFRENKWMGFRENNLETIIEFTEEVSLKKVTASILSNPDAWIFPPSGMEVLISEDGRDFHEIAKKEFILIHENIQTGPQFISVDFKKEQSRFLKIIVKNLAEIPEWHPGKGTPAWIFIDEILTE